MFSKIPSSTQKRRKINAFATLFPVIMNKLLIVNKISHILYYCESLAGLISPSSCKTGNSNFIQC